MASIRMDAPGLSREHFEIRHDGADWMIRDMGSRNGIQVNRRPVQEAVLRPGDEIQAGDTRYRIDRPVARRRILEEGDGVVGPLLPDATQNSDRTATVIMPLAVYDHVSPTLEPETPRVVDGSLLASLVSACSDGRDGRVFAVIDGAQAFELAFTARLMGNKLYTLFSGKQAADLAHVGPCLVELTKPAAFLEEWAGAVGAHPGVLLQSPANLQTIYAHLRHLFIATDEDGREYFFRFYDPRVLRVFLPTCLEGELTEFFGPVVSWIAEQDGGRELCRYQHGANGLTTQRIAER